jgi:cytochrome c biogenesis protein CcdA
MTRSFVAIVRGNWQEAIDYHLFGPLLFFIFGLALVHSILELLFGYTLQIFYLKWLTRIDLQLSIIISFFGYYFLRITHLIPINHL